MTASGCQAEFARDLLDRPSGNVNRQVPPRRRSEEENRSQGSKDFVHIDVVGDDVPNDRYFFAVSEGRVFTIRSWTFEAAS